MEGKRVETTNLAGVLQLVLRHSSTWEPRDLCQLLQVSSSCRQALQQSRCKCDVDLDFWQLQPESKCKLLGFSEWLPTHIGLVSSFTWMGGHSGSPEHQQEFQLLQRHLAFALQVCRFKTAAAAATAATARALGDVTAQTQPLPLQLTTAVFYDSWPEPQLLRELAAAGVQVLEMIGDLQEPPMLLSPCFAISSLQSLTILDDACSVVHSAGFLSAIQQLSALTSLQFTVVPADAAHQLPPQLRELMLTLAVGSNGSTAVSLSHLAALRQLTCDAAVGSKDLELFLPPNLTDLHFMMRAGGSISKLTGAAALQNARMQGLSGKDVNMVVGVCNLPVLSSLSIDYSGFTSAPAASAVAAALGSATALTRLWLCNVSFTDGTGLCKQLAKLPRLAGLQLWKCSMSEGCSDLLCLTGLTSLTSLALSGRPDSTPNDVVVAVVASHLTGLRDLRYVSESMSSLGLLPVVGALTRLSRLWLCGGDQFVVGPDGLMLLTSLTGLKELTLRTLDCSEAEEQQFLACMPNLTEVDFC